jgi:hypothetical protein
LTSLLAAELEKRTVGVRGLDKAASGSGSTGRRSARGVTSCVQTSAARRRRNSGGRTSSLPTWKRSSGPRRASSTSARSGTRWRNACRRTSCFRFWHTRCRARKAPDVGPARCAGWKTLQTWMERSGLGRGARTVIEELAFPEPPAPGGYLPGPRAAREGGRRDTADVGGARREAHVRHAAR